MYSTEEHEFMSHNPTFMHCNEDVILASDGFHPEIRDGIIHYPHIQWDGKRLKANGKYYFPCIIHWLPRG